MSAPTHPIFNPGDLVEFEKGPYRRRWDMGGTKDAGGTGKWIQTTVSKVMDDYVYTKPEGDSFACLNWPLLGGLWGSPGYLRHVRREKRTKTTEQGRPCECDMDSLMTQGCLCGGE